MEFENKRLLFWPSRAPRSFAKGFRFLELYLLFLPEHGFRPAGRVDHPTHLSHPTLVGGLKDDESDGGYLLKAKLGKNFVKSSISITFTSFRSLTEVRMT